MPIFYNVYSHLEKHVDKMFGKNLKKKTRITATVKTIFYNVKLKKM